MQSKSRRFLEFTNQKDFPVAYTIDTRQLDSAVHGDFKIDPPSGILQSGQSKAFIFEYKATTQAETIQAEIALQLTPQSLEKAKSVAADTCSEEIIAIHPDPSQTTTLDSHPLLPKIKTCHVLHRGRLTERTLHGDSPRHLSSTISSRTKSDALNRNYQQFLLEQAQSNHDDHPSDRSETLIIDIQGHVISKEPKNHVSITLAALTALTFASDHDSHGRHHAHPRLMDF